MGRPARFPSDPGRIFLPYDFSGRRKQQKPACLLGVQSFEATAQICAGPDHLHPVLHLQGEGPVMNGIVTLRFAMDTWAITFQSLIIGPLSPSAATPAKRIGASLEHSLDGYPSAAHLGASKMGELGVYRVYVKFNFPPEPEHARELLRRACEDAGALHYSISDNLNYQEAVKFPYELDESVLDIGLAHSSQSRTDRHCCDRRTRLLLEIH